MNRGTAAELRCTAVYRDIIAVHRDNFHPGIYRQAASNVEYKGKQLQQECAGFFSKHSFAEALRSMLKFCYSLPEQIGARQSFAIASQNSV